MVKCVKSAVVPVISLMPGCLLTGSYICFQQLWLGYYLLLAPGHNRRRLIGAVGIVTVRLFEGLDIHASIHGIVIILVL